MTKQHRCIKSCDFSSTVWNIEKNREVITSAFSRYCKENSQNRKYPGGTGYVLRASEGVISYGCLLVISLFFLEKKKKHIIFKAYKFTHFDYEFSGCFQNNPFWGAAVTRISVSSVPLRLYCGPLLSPLVNEARQ